MGHFLDKNAKLNDGLTKDPEGFSSVERQIFNHNSAGESDFKQGLKMTNTQANKTHEALKAWASYESFS